MNDPKKVSTTTTCDYNELTRPALPVQYFLKHRNFIIRSLSLHVYDASFHKYDASSPRQLIFPALDISLRSKDCYLYKYAHAFKKKREFLKCRKLFLIKLEGNKYGNERNRNQGQSSSQQELSRGNKLLQNIHKVKGD